jgi:hypothetical protein
LGSKDEKDWVLIRQSSAPSNNANGGSTSTTNSLSSTDGDDEGLLITVRNTYEEDEASDANWAYQQRNGMAVDASPVVINRNKERQFTYGYTYQHLVEGWITKKGNIVPSYKRRWVRLTLSPPQFQYFPKRPDTSELRLFPPSILFACCFTELLLICVSLYSS